MSRQMHTAGSHLRQEFDLAALGQRILQAAAVASAIHLARQGRLLVGADDPEAARAMLGREGARAAR